MIGLMKKDLYVADKTGRLLLVLAVAATALAFRRSPEEMRRNHQ